MNEKEPEEAERGSALRMSSPLKKVSRSPGTERMWPSEDIRGHGKLERPNAERTKLGVILVVIQGCESCLQGALRFDRRKTTNSAHSGASDSSKAHIISVPSSLHSLESGSCHDKGAVLGRAVVDAPTLRSVQTHDIRRAGTREKVCCLPTRMVSTVLDCEVP